MGERSFRVDNLVSALVGGAVGGLLVWWLLPTPSTAVAPDPVAAAETGAEPIQGEPPPARQASEDADRRLKRLETSMRNVQKRVTEQSQVDVYEEGAGGSGGNKRVTLSAADPKFQSAVRAVLDKAKWEDEQIEQDKRDERRDQRISRQVEELAKVLDLNDDQANQVEIVLQSRADTFRELRDSENRPVTRQEWREKFTEIQGQTRKKLAEFLDEDQMSAYDKHQEEAGFGPWGRPPRPSR